MRIEHGETQVTRREEILRGRLVALFVDGREVADAAVRSCHGESPEPRERADERSLEGAQQSDNSDQSESIRSDEAAQVETAVSGEAESATTSLTVSSGTGTKTADRASAALGPASMRRDHPGSAGDVRHHHDVAKRSPRSDS
jgi:hypothetical protein